MKKILFLTNIPTPYRVEFFNALGRFYDVTVIFEARRARNIRFSWGPADTSTFRAIFLSEGEIEERRVNWRVISHLRRGGYDFVVGTNYGYLTEFAALLYLAGTRVPFYLEVDGGTVPAREGVIRRRVKQFVVGTAAGCLSPSERADEMLRYYGARPGSIWRYPFTSLQERDIVRLPPSPEEKRLAKAELGIRQRAMVLGAGQFIRRKGFDLLLRASAQLPPDTALCLAGAPPTEEFRALAARLPNVYFPGFLSWEELRRYFLAADVFALPTRGDVWGLVVNEALAHALPVVTTDQCGAGAELVTHGMNGFIVPAEDIDALARQLGVLLSDDTRRQTMAENALESIRPYTISGMVEAHRQVFESRESA